MHCISKRKADAGWSILWGILILGAHDPSVAVQCIAHLGHHGLTLPYR